MRILLIEDEEDLAAALQRGLQRQGYAVDSALDDTAGWELLCTHRYDLLILDLNLPGIDGLDLCAQARASQPGLLILILTARARPDDRIVGLDSGADDYLVKPFHFGELAARVRALLRRDMRVRAPLLQCGGLKLDPASRAAWLHNRPLALTHKECALLEYLLRHPGEVISQETLLEHVWDAHANPMTNVVRVHITALRRKLHHNASASPRIETVIGAGYRLCCAAEQEAPA
jgi:DNA-binding response OmpR family regulator